VTIEPEGVSSPLDGLVQADVDALLAPALDLAVMVAKALGQLRPPVPVPRGLRPVVRFTRLPSSARPAVRRALDEDEEFRCRVADVADETALPRGPWLYLHRPPGWQEELAELVRRAVEEGAALSTERADRALQRRLDGAEAAVTRLEQALATARVEAARAVEEVAVERRARREAVARLDALRRRVASLEQERDGARRRADERGADAERLRAAVEAARAGAEATSVQRDAAQGELEAARAALADADARVAATSGRSEAVVGAVAGAIDEAADAAGALGRALAAAAAALGVGGEGRGDPIAGDDGAGDPAPVVGDGSWRREEAHGVATPSRAARAARARDRPGRRPAPLPPAVFDDSPEAAEHLVRLPGMVMLVDGYNATLSAWRDLPISVQRLRLVDACGELAARSGAEVVIVFDGAEEPGDLPPRAAHRGVRWRFSPVDVEADDVLLELVSGLDPDRPVTVASSDRRVRDGARARGANAISTPQLFAALRRERGSRRTPGPGPTVTGGVHTSPYERAGPDDQL